jgi:hypothetical protein
VTVDSGAVELFTGMYGPLCWGLVAAAGVIAGRAEAAIEQRPSPPQTPPRSWGGPLQHRTVVERQQTRCTQSGRDLGVQRST